MKVKYQQYPHADIVRNPDFTTRGDAVAFYKQHFQLGTLDKKALENFLKIHNL